MKRFLIIAGVLTVAYFAYYILQLVLYMIVIRYPPYLPYGSADDYAHYLLLALIMIACTMFLYFTRKK